MAEAASRILWLNFRFWNMAADPLWLEAQAFVVRGSDRNGTQAFGFY